MRSLCGLSLLLIMAAAACAQATPSRVGLVLVYEALTPDGGAPDAQQMQQLKAVLERRLREGGVGGVVEIGSSGRFVVNTPEVADPEAVRELVTRAARLEIVPLPPDRYGTVSTPGPLDVLVPGEEIPADLDPLLTGQDFVSFRRIVDPITAQPVVEFELGPRGSDRLADHTRAHIGEFFAVALDRIALTVPSISEAIEGGKGQISVAGGPEEADRLLALLQSDELPLIVREIR